MFNSNIGTKNCSKELKIIFQESSGYDIGNEDVEPETNSVRDLHLGSQNVLYFYTLASSITRNLPGQ